MNDDTISRQAVISELNKYVDYSDDGEQEINADIVFITLKEFPSAERRGRWIPVTERLPENTDPVNITWVNRKPSGYYKHIKGKPFVATGHYCNGRWYWFSAVCQDYLNEYGDCEMDRIEPAVEIVAWMPLPSPYKGGEEE